MYICFWIGASEPRAYIVGLIGKQPSELGVGLTRVTRAKKDSCEIIQHDPPSRIIDATLCRSKPRNRSKVVKSFLVSD